MAFSTHADAEAAINDKSMELGVLPTGAKAVTLPRWACNNANFVSGSTGLKVALIYLTAGTVVTSIVIPSASTAGASLTHCRVGLYTTAAAGPVLLGEAPDDTTATWAASTTRTFTLSSAYTVTASGFFYIGALLVGTTIPTFLVNNASAGTGAAALPPISGGITNTGLAGTSGLPNPAGAVAANANHFFAYVI